eukprot:jgi/Mesen1/8698/ME000052S08130
MLGLGSIITSLATSLLIGCILIAIFIILQNLFEVLYFSAVIDKGSGPPPKSRRPWQWLTEVFTTKEDALVSFSGLDAAVYLKFLRTCCFILLWALLYCLPVLLPLCISDDFYSRSKAQQTDPDKEVSFSDFDKLSMGNITPQSKRLWAFCIGAYWVTLGALYILFRTYIDVVRLRAKYRDASDSRAESMAVLVRDIPHPHGKATPAEQIDAYMGRLHSHSYLRSMLVPRLKKVLAVKAKKKVDKMKRKLAHALAEYEQAKEEHGLEAQRPTTKSKFWGLWGPKVDAIDLYSEKLQHEVKLLHEQQLRVVEHAGGGAAIAFFSNPIAAGAAAQCLHSADADKWTVSEAPEPRDVVWSNLAVPMYQRSIRKILIYIFMFLLICFYYIPIGFVSSLTTLSNLQKTIPFLEPIVKINAVRTIVGAYLPQLALIIFLALLPKLCLLLSKLEGIPSKSHIERAGCGKLYYFYIFNVFLGVTISGTIFNQLQQLIDSPKSIVNLLGTALPQNASFFITFIALRFLVTKSMELIRLIPLLLYLVKRKSTRTEGELRRTWTPKSLSYIKHVPNDELIITLGLCYAVIAPLILPFSALYFGFTWVVMKNQALNVYVPRYESRGRMWPHMHARITVALLLAQVTMIGYSGIKKFVGTLILVPLPVITILYYIYARNRFYRTFQYDPLEVVIYDTTRAPPVETLLEAYMPESLKQEDGQLDPDDSRVLPLPKKKNMRGTESSYVHSSIDNGQVATNEV